MDWHPIASVFPMLSLEELDALADDIRQHGLREPIVTFEDKILDGRNREKACQLAGIDPEYVSFDGTREAALAHAWSKNRRRRHLDSSQAAIAEAHRLKLSEEYAAEVKNMTVDAAGRKASQGGDHRSSEARQVINITEGNHSRSDREAGRVKTRRAKAAGTNRKYLEAADKLIEHHPDLANDVLQGEMTIPAAVREMKKTSKKKSKPVSVRPPVQSVAISAANDAVNCLRSISLEDPKRGRGLQIVEDWIINNRDVVGAFEGRETSEIKGSSINMTTALKGTV